ncbi:MAG: M20/M25/M40 family metallo-hydrolase [Luteitalea sp.]|nr:M20/M25/M40 family metallo-hydrolase [Luteitalea sp.]
MRPIARLLLLLTMAAGVACAPSGGRFQEVHARAHISMLAGTIGSRPVGTTANRRARGYLVEQLQLYGFSVRVQETDAVDHEHGRTARVANIIALKPGARREAIALVAHYDSVPDAPGAMDDALGTAVCLEAARVLAAGRQRTHSLVILLTDGEEVGLMGARAALLDSEFAERTRAYLNFEAIGGSGPALLFEVGPGSGTPLGAWARAAAPRGASSSTEIYKHLPNDTDFSVLARAQLFGLNFAPVGDSYAYHTARDVPERISGSTIRHMGENAVTIVERLDRLGIATRSDPAIFFDVAGRWGLAYSYATGRAIAVAALLLGLLACATLVVELYRACGLLRLVMTVAWSVVAVAVVLTAMLGAAWALRATRAEYHPWYASPHWLYLFLITAGLAAGWAVRRGAAAMPERMRAIGAPAGVWAMALPVWLAATALAAWGAPGASHSWSIPLGVAGALLLVTRAAAGPVRFASVVIASTVILFWADETTQVVGFLAPMFGRMPFVTPLWAYPAHVGVVALLLAPPLVALVVGRPRRGTPHGLVGAVLLFALVVTAGFAYASDGYTVDRPARRSARFVQDGISRRAFWEIAGQEPGVDLHGHGPHGAAWQRVGDVPPTSVPLPSLAGPFIFRSPAAALDVPPADVTARVAPGASGLDLEIIVTPRAEGLTVDFVLPHGVRPLQSNLAGTFRDGRWRATMIAPPTDGVVLRARLGDLSLDTLQSGVVTIVQPGLPGGAGWQRLPAWLPQERSVWTARSIYLVSAAPQIASPLTGPPVLR